MPFLEALHRSLGSPCYIHIFILLFSFNVNLKKIEALVHSDKTNAVVSTLVDEFKLGGVTVIRGNGQGAGKREEVSVGRGTARATAMFNPIDTIILGIDDSKVDQVVESITKNATTGSKGDGKIFVSNIDDVADIGSKKRGKEAL